MIEREINGKKRLCFLVKKGEASDIVIPIEYLQKIDYKRLSEMEAQGGELMRTMRDTELDNGANALVTYQNLLVAVQNVNPVAAAKETPQPRAPSNTIKKKVGKKRGRKPKVRTQE